MALKKEQTEVKYSEMIGVNRGSGFSALADASLTQANALNNLTAQFADQGLKTLKKYGKKIGEEAAENAVFSQVEQEITLPDGTKQKQFVTGPVPELKIGKFTNKSAAEAYEKNIFDKYKNEVQSTIKNIIIEERSNAIAENRNGDGFNEIVNARIEPILTDLEPKFKTLVTTYSNDQQQQHWYQVESKFLDRKEKRENLEYTNGIKVKLNEYDSLMINGASIEDLKAKEDEIKDFIKTYKDEGNDNAVATGDLTISNLSNTKQAFNTLQTIIPENYINLSANDQSNVVDDLLKFEQILQGGVKSITLSNGKKITNTEISKMFNNDAQAQENMSIRVSKIRTDFKAGLDSKIKNNIFTSHLAIAVQNGPTGMPPYFGDMSKKEIQTGLQAEQNIEFLASQYNQLDGVEPITDFSMKAYEDVEFTKYVLRITNQLPFFMVDQIEKSFAGNNQNAIQFYFNNGLIPAIQNMTTSFKTKSNDGKNSFTSTMQLSNMALLDLKDETIAKINIIDNFSTIMPLNEAIAMTVDYYNKREASNIKSGNLAQHLISSGSKVTETQLNKRILTDIEEIVDTESYFTDDAIFSRKIYELVKTDVHRMVLSGGALINTEGDITSFVKQSMAKIMSPDSQFGYDKYTFTSFENPSDMDWNDQPEDRFVYLPAKKYFGLPNAKGEETAEWMAGSIDKLVKSSSEYKEGIAQTTGKNPFKFTFGKNIFLQPNSFTKGSPTYNIVQLDENDVPTILTDDNGIPIIYDPRPEYQERISKMSGSTNFDKSINEAKKHNLQFKDDNRLLESGLTVAEDRMLQNLDAKDKIEGVSDFDNFQINKGMNEALTNRGFK